MNISLLNVLCLLFHSFLDPSRGSKQPPRGGEPYQVCSKGISGKDQFTCYSSQLTFTLTIIHCLYDTCSLVSFPILYCIVIFLSFSLLLKVLVYLSFCSRPTRLASLLSGGNCTVLQLFVNIIVNDGDDGDDEEQLTFNFF